MHKKDKVRLKRARQTRARIAALGAYRLTVHRSSQHIYAQVILDGKTIAAASTVEKSVAEGLKASCNVEAAKKVGATVAERAKAKGVSAVAFDRSGFQYHGRIQALADAAREAGLEF